MKRSKFSEAQIAFVLKQAEDGTSVGEVCRKAGISEATYYNLRKKYAGLMPSEMKRLRQLEEENAKLSETGSEQKQELDSLTRDNMELEAGARWPHWITGASLLAVGMLMGAIYLATAAALWWWHGRIGLALVAGFQLIPLLGYAAAAGLREPPFELWGVLIKVGQLVVLVAATALAYDAPRRTLPAARPSPKEGLA